MVLAVAHREFASWGIARIRGFARSGGVLFELKRMFASADCDGRL